MSCPLREVVVPGGVLLVGTLETSEVYVLGSRQDTAEHSHLQTDIRGLEGQA